MRARLARRLVGVAVWLAGGCPCGPCARERQLIGQAGRMAEQLPRRQRREIHRGAWRFGQRPRQRP